MPDKLIRQVQVDSTTIPHELSAKYIQDGANNKTWEDITALVTAGFTIEAPWIESDYTSTSAPSAAKLATIPAGVEAIYNSGVKPSGVTSWPVGTLSASATESRRHIYLIYHPHGGKDSFDEYVSTGSAWEKIGSTDIDLSTYATKAVAAKAGTYTTGSQSTSASGEAGAATITTSEGGSHTAAATVTITYDKSANATGSSGGTGTSANTGNAGAATLTSGAAGAHTHTVELTTASATIFNVSPETGSKGAHTHAISGTVASHTHDDDVAASKINSYTAPSMSTITFTQNGSDTWSAGSLPSYTQGSKAAWSASVTNGILSFSWAANGDDTWSAGTLPSYTQGSKATLTGGVFNAGTLTYSAVTAASGKTAATLDIGAEILSAGAHTHSISCPTSIITYATGVSSVSSADAHTHSVTIADHSHSYTAPAAHTHGISLTSTETSAAISIPIGGHTHTVTISNHTHSIGHTHNTQIPNCNS